ncbi:MULTISPECIES: phospholipase D-like domain-containing protein [Flavobacterium]|uniref:phospholipase D n=1 Tax=Flavobacterium jumunjinense TaxID=998845 RepID=A0ABV5GT60_9FLAO|nr:MULTISPECIES: phospholipase D-like domain-containing protein [Flavobacterium]
MNDILTNGIGIKQRIISEIQTASKDIYLAMAWFTDRDIANSIIDAKNRNLTVDIILSSNVQNETVKKMFENAGVNVHAFETGDDRGTMHHKFCLIDSKITINGSYNYSYNASNNNVENIQVSDDFNTYRQFFAEFERLKYNIEHQIDLNINTANQTEQVVTKTKTINVADSFSQQLSNLVYATANINTETYRKKGHENSKESSGSIEIFKANYLEIKEQIKMYATDDSLSNKKNIISQNITSAFESKKAEIDADRLIQFNKVKMNYEIETKQLNAKISEVNQEKSIFERGNQDTGEKGLLQLNNEIEKNKLERNNLESTLVTKKFWTIGIVFSIIGLFIFMFYLSMFFASAMYKVFFEGNIIRNSLESGINPGLPQLVDANAIVKIFKTQGGLFGIMSGLFFLIPILLSNLKLIGSKNKGVNILCFVVGLLVFDVLVSTMVALNTDEIKSLLVGKESQLKIWEVITHTEFWLIFVFGMLPLVITHFIIEFIVTAYQKSQREIVDAEKSKQIKMLDKLLLDLNMQKELFNNKIKEKENVLNQKNEELEYLERDLNSSQNENEAIFTELLKSIKSIYDDFMTTITSGKIFTDEILNSVSTAYKSGYIEFLPELYAEKEVANRVRAIEQVITNNY